MCPENLHIFVQNIRVMKTIRLQKKLKSLDTDEIHRAAAVGKVPSEFMKIAEAVFNGHFLISSTMGSVKVYPTCIELYWHEEQGDIKDYIVYHRNSAKENPEIFPHGILHNHVSGIDFTFEQGDKPESAIRASILIREYKIAKNGEIIEEKRPTYLYEAIYSQFSVFDGGFSIIWEDDANARNTISDADCTPRYNVANYIRDNGNIVKEPYITGETSGSKTANGKYVQDERRWRFTLNDHDTRF